MRTLKKVLALSMVFAMAFSMMAGAAFNDQDQIDASLTEDIQLLTALQVFQGDEKGDFNPTDNVTRAQAAKMIYVLKNNGVDDEAAAFKGNSVYSDVPAGHWAEGYINYCTNLGIMSGWNEGSVRKFDPNGNVTGLELTKMLLCMIGYRADIQGYTGSGWQTNVLKDGAASAITTNYLPTIYNAAPRQWTARLMKNAIDAPYASYSRGELVTGSATEPTRSYGVQYLGLVMYEGYLQDAGKVAMTLTESETSLDDDGDEIIVTKNKNLTTVTNDNGETVSAARNFKTTVDPMMLGQHVKVYYKSGTTTTYEAKVYAVLPTGKSKVYDTTLADVTTGQNDNGETIKFSGYNGGSAKTYTGHTVKADNANGEVENSNINDLGDNVANRDIKLVKNLDKIETVKPLVKNNNNTKGGTADDKRASLKTFGAFSGNSNEAIRFVDMDGDGYIDVALTNKVDYALVSAHNASRNTIRFTNANNSALKLVDGDVVNSEAAYKKVNFVNEVAQDDVVKVTLDTTSGTKVWNVEKVEPISGSVSGYSLSSGNYGNITLNGETTKFAKNKMDAYGISATDNTSVLSDTSFYTDGKFIVYSKGGENVASVGNLAYIIATDQYEAWQEKTVYAKVLLSDGTQGQYEVAATYKLIDKDATDSNVNSETAKDVTNTDGKLVKTTLSGIAGGVDRAMLTNGKVMSYSISNNKITLSDLKSDSASTGIKFYNGTQSYDHSKKVYNTGVVGNLKMADESYFFVKSYNNDNEAKYNVVKGSELGKTLEHKADGYTNQVVATKQNTDGMNYVVFGTLDIQGNAVATAAEYAFVKSAASYTVIDGEHVAQMTVVLPDGTESVIKKSFTTVSGANSQVNTWNGLRGRVVRYDLDTEGNVDGDVVRVTTTAATDVTATAAHDKWAKAQIIGWNGSSAMITINGGSSQLVNVASDAKIHIVNTTDEDYTVMSDGSVEKTAHKINEDGSEGDLYTYSAFVYLQDVSGQPTITDIYSVEEGVDAEKLWK